MKGFRELALVISVLLLTCASSNAQEACCQRDSLASTPPQLNSEQSDNQKHSGLTIKTNLLGWMMLGANVAVEYDIIPHLSVALPFYYSGWDYGKETLKFRGLVLQPEVRFYIKDNDERTAEIVKSAQAAAYRTTLYVGLVAVIVAGYFSITVSLTILGCIWIPALLGVAYKFYFSRKI